MIALPSCLHALADDGKRSVFTAQNEFLYTHGMMTEAAFARQVGQVFEVTLEDGSRTRMRLAEVTPLAQASGTGRHRSAATGFTLSFAMLGAALQQGAYTVESPVNGPSVMFLVPGAPQGPATCTAVFASLPVAAGTSPIVTPVRRTSPVADPVRGAVAEQ